MGDVSAPGPPKPRRRAVSVTSGAALVLSGAVALTPATAHLGPTAAASGETHDQESIELAATIAPAGEGHLVLTISGDGSPVRLAEATLTENRRLFTGDLPEITVSDSRAEDQARESGWAVAGQATPLTAASNRIEAGNLGWAPALLDQRAGVAAGDPVAPTLSGGPGLQAPQQLVAATPQGRFGTVRSTAALRLEVPEDTAPGTYTGEVTVSLFPVD